MSMILKHWSLISRFHKLILRSSADINVSPSLYMDKKADHHLSIMKLHEITFYSIQFYTRAFNANKGNWIKREKEEIVRGRKLKEVRGCVVTSIEL